MKSARNNRCGSGCGAYHAHHGAFDDDTSGHIVPDDGGYGQNDEGQDLGEYEFELPTVGAQLAWMYLAKGQEQHTEDECRLSDAHHIRHELVGVVEGRYVDIYDV